MVAPDQTKTVFVVDDDPDIRMAMEVSLEIHGFRVELFDSADAFLRGYSNNHGCLLLDLNLGGGMNGLELQSELANRNIDLPVIFISGHGGSTELKRAIDAGAIAFLQKPFQPAVLIDHIETAFAQPSIA